MTTHYKQPRLGFPEWSRRETEARAQRRSSSSRNCELFIQAHVLTSHCADFLLTAALDFDMKSRGKQWTGLLQIPPAARPVWNSICALTHKVRRRQHWCSSVTLLGFFLFFFLLWCNVFVFLLCTDSVVERRALRETVFPELREHYRNTLGVDVRVSKHFTFHSCTLLTCCSRGDIILSIFLFFYYALSLSQ